MISTLNHLEKKYLPILILKKKIYTYNEPSKYSYDIYRLLSDDLQAKKPLDLFN